MMLLNQPLETRNQKKSISSAEKSLRFCSTLAWGLATLAGFGVIFYLGKILLLGNLFLPPAEQVTASELIAYGTFSDWHAKEHQESAGDSKKQSAMQPRIATNSDQIEGKLNAVFGIVFKIDAEPSPSQVSLKFRIDHPLFGTAPLPSRKMFDEWEGFVVAGTESRIAWIFEYPWEVEAGDWDFTVSHGENVLLSKRFRVSISGGDISRENTEEGK